MTQKNLISVVKTFGDLAGDGIFIATLQSPQQLEYVNKCLREIFDISHPTFARQPDFYANHVLPADLPHLRKQYEKVLTEHRAENVNFRVRRHDGSIRYLSGSFYAIEGGFVLGLVRDITRLREHEAYIVDYGGKKNTLLEMVLHNLGEPLTISKDLLENADRAINDGGKLDLEELRKQLRLVQENTNHCIEMVTDFLEEEHLLSETIFTKKVRFNLIDKIETALERFKKGFPDHHFKLTYPARSLTITNDEVKFLQVITNLLSNAVKFSPAGSTVEIEVHDQPDRLAISIRDHGIGIPDQLKSKIFQRNTPARRQGLRDEKSVGIGLYITRTLTKLMNGDITFESEEQKGATFTVAWRKED